MKEKPDQPRPEHPEGGGEPPGEEASEGADPRRALVQEWIRAVHDVGRLILHTTDSRDLIRNACARLAEAPGSGRAWIALTDGAGGVAAFASSGLGERGPAFEARLRAGEHPECLHEAFAAGPDSPDVSPLTRVREGCDGCPLGEGAEGFEAVASRLVVRDRTLGLLCLSVPGELLQDGEGEELIAALALDLALGLYWIEVAEERARTERELLRANRRLQVAQEIGGLGDWDWDPATDTVTWSDNLYAILGLDPREPPPDFEGQVRLYHPDDRERFRRAVEAAVEAGEAYTLELRRIRPDGRELVLLVEGKVETDAQGQVERLYGTVLDITERKRVERELADTLATLQAAMDNSTAGIAIADAPDGTLRYVNRAGLLIRGGSWEEIVNGVGVDEYVSSWQILDLDGTPLPRDEVPLARAVLYGETSSREFIVRREDEVDRTVLANAAPIRNAEGEVIAGIVVFLDVTEKKAVEAALRESEARYRSVFENSGAPMVIVEGDTTIQVANGQFCDLVGLPREEIQGRRRWTEFIAPADLERMRRQHDLRREDPDAAEKQYEFKLVTSRGEERRIFLTVDLIPGTDLSVASLVDITPLKETEEELRALTHRTLAVREQEQERLGRELHDDLGAILTGLRMDLSAMHLESRQGRDVATDRLADLLDQADEAVAFVRDHAAELRSPVLDLLGLGPAIRAQVEKLEARGTAEFIAEIDESEVRLSPEVEINLFRIAQEILTNVTRHAGAGTVRVRFCREDGDLLLEIADDGVGIPDEVLRSGTSMGLLGMRERAMAIGADLDIETLENGGTLVRVRLEEELARSGVLRG